MNTTKELFNLDEKQMKALELVVESLQHALHVKVSVTALTFAIEGNNCGLIELMNILKDRQYANGPLGKRIVDCGGQECADALGISLDSFARMIQHESIASYGV